MNCTSEHGISLLNIIGISLNPEEELFIREGWDSLYDPNGNVIDLLKAVYCELIPGCSVNLSEKGFLKIVVNRYKHFDARIHEISLDKKLTMPKGLNPAYQ